MLPPTQPETQPQTDRQKIAVLEAETARYKVETARFEDRYQNLLAKFYEAQAKQLKCTQQHTDLQQVVQAKQQVINALLLFYPKPLTPEQDHAIGLTGEPAA